MADLEERRISDLTRALEVDSSALFEASFPDESSESGYSSYATDVETMAQKILGGINFETQLQTNAKNIFGAINEANKHGGGGGSDVAMSDNPNGGVDLDVEGTIRTLAEQETIDGVVAIEENEEVDEIDVLEPSDIANMATKSDIQSCMKVTSHTLLWNKTNVITLPSIPCIVWGSRGNGSSEKGFMFALDVYGSEFMNIKNSANATIAWGGRETKQLTVTLGNGTGSSITMYCAYV